LWKFLDRLAFHRHSITQPTAGFGHQRLPARETADRLVCTREQVSRYNNRSGRCSLRRPCFIDITFDGFGSSTSHRASSPDTWLVLSSSVLCTSPDTFAEAPLPYPAFATPRMLGPHKPDVEAATPTNSIGWLAPSERFSHQQGHGILQIILRGGLVVVSRARRSHDWY
jgi:hypothetical protein